jgi:hypothetical protein
MTAKILGVLEGSTELFMHMSFLTGQDRTPKFAGQVLLDPTEFGLISLNIYQTIAPPAAQFRRP